jgi:hypothetical protein
MIGNKRAKDERKPFQDNRHKPKEEYQDNFNQQSFFP